MCTCKWLQSVVLMGSMLVAAMGCDGDSKDAAQDTEKNGIGTE